MDLNLDRKNSLKFFYVFGGIIILAYIIFEACYYEAVSFIGIELHIGVFLFVFFLLALFYRLAVYAFNSNFKIRIMKKSLNILSFDEIMINPFTELFLKSKFFPPVVNCFECVHGIPSHFTFEKLNTGSEFVISDVVAGEKYYSGSSSNGGSVVQYKKIFKGILFTCKQKDKIFSINNCLITNRPYKYHFGNIRRFRFVWKQPFKNHTKIKTNKNTWYVYSDEIEEAYTQNFTHLISLLENIYIKTSFKPNLSLIDGCLYITIPFKCKFPLLKKVKPEKVFFYENIFSIMIDESCKTYDAIIVSK